ncbi:MAG TPA: hypothetical protein VF169_25020 [Albitalea sp.]|uniref:hypothetical protein n=1 Tax=Piscinibacter sp. TaxID=1903157 RepID=UPI002ED67675
MTRTPLGPRGRTWNNAGQSVIDLASSEGCLDDLLRGMSESLPPQEVDRALAWKDSKQRNILSAMASASGDGLAAVRQLVARKACGDFQPKLTFQIAPEQQQTWEALQSKVSADWDHQLDTRQVAAVARFMKEARLKHASASEVADALPLALASGLRPAFEAARAVYASGVCDINDRNEDGHTCLHDLSLEQKASASVWGFKPEDRADVGIEERLAVMMQLGADPFSTGEDGKLPSAEQLTLDRACEALTKPFADIRSTLRTMTAELDEKGLSAWANSTSREAVNFFQDLGIKRGLHAFDDIQSPIAINQWLRRNPNKIQDSLQPGLLNHPLHGASAQVIGAYVDAIRTRPSFDDSYQGDINLDLKAALGWTKRCSDLIYSNPGNATLFNCSSSIDSAKTLLVARISAEPGDSEWDDFCELEWRFLLGNVEDSHPKQHVSSVDLAALLLEHGVYPPNELLSGAAAMSNWKEIREKIDSRNEATNLWGKVLQGERSAKDLSKAEWALLVPHAHRMLADAPYDKFKNCMQSLGMHLGSTSKCDQATRVAFLKSSYQGKEALGDTDAKEKHRAMWDKVVGTYRIHLPLPGARKPFGRRHSGRSA